MNEYFVAGGTYQDPNGHEYFGLACPSSSEPPYIMVDDIMCLYVIWQNAHLYRVEADYTLSLLAPSPEALQYGVRAPERVWPDAILLKKLQAVIKRGTPSDLPKEIGHDGCLKLIESMTA
jgi:hypothetical protein